MRLAPLVASAALALLAAPASAQTLRGRVVDDDSQRPIEGAALRLIGADETMGASALSPANGTFTLRAPAAGTYRLTAERIGFATLTLGPFDLPEGAPLDITVAMQMEAIVLDSIAVEVDPTLRFLRNMGFYDRRKLGIGQFIDRQQIEESRAHDLSDVLERGITGMRMVRKFGFADLEMRPGVIATLGNAQGQGINCAPLVYLNGMLVARNTSPSNNPAEWGVGRFNLESLAASDLEAVEVFAGQAQAPVQFARDGGRCGVVLIWTRRR